MTSPIELLDQAQETGESNGRKHNCLISTGIALLSTRKHVKVTKAQQNSTEMKL